MPKRPLRSATAAGIAAGILAGIAVPPSSRAQAPEGGTSLQAYGETVTLLRDSYGVPHVFAASERAAYWGNGYAVAQDRLAQLEKYRRTARGEMAELAGSGALAADKEARTGGYTEAEREQQVAALRPELRAAIEAYADGVNAYIQACEKNGFPTEVKKLGIAIRPWKTTDTAAIGQMMARRFGGGGGGELRNLQILSLLKIAFGDKAQDAFDDLAWQNDPAAPATLTREESPRDPVRMGEKPVSHSPILPLSHSTRRRQLAQVPAQAEDLEPARRMADLDAGMAYARENGLPTKWGSYAIAVSPKKRADGIAALVGAPQMGFATPQIAHEVHLSAPGLNVVGMGFAGIPGVLIGHNDRVAWSTTTGVGDVEDVFVETLDPADPKRYRFKGEWKTMERRVETIRVRGGEPVEHEVLRTVHGPVLQVDAGKKVAYAKQSSYWNREMGALEVVHRFNRARDLKQFQEAVPFIATSHNWLCATQDGDIGYWFAGRFPLRAPGVDPRMPTPGEGDHEWRGFRSFSELPQAVNPEKGWFANWNNKPAVWWESGDTPAWSSAHRVQRIFDLMAAKDAQTTDDLKAILRDIGDFDDRAPYLKPLLIEAFRANQGSDPKAKMAAEILASWDNHATDGSVGKQIFDTYVRQLRSVLFGSKFLLVPQNLQEQALSAGVLLRILQGKSAPLPVKVDYLAGRTPREVMLTALGRTLETLTSERGPDMTSWGYRLGRINFNPLPGTPTQNRGTYIQIVDLARPRVHGVSILPPGQSEDPASPHYSDQRELAGYWLFKPMHTTRESLAAGRK